MNAAIRDADALAALDPQGVVAYLKSTGWSVVRQEPGKAAYLELPSGEDVPFEVLLPFDRSYGDFARRMGQLVETLGQVENRSQLDLYKDLTTANDDVIRFRVKAKDSSDGTVPIDIGAGVVEQARRVVLAGATAVARPGVRYLANTPTEAERYLRNHVRLGQTEIGSYVVTVLSRVTPELSTNSNGLSIESSRVPFERQATTSLAVALDHTRIASEEAVVTGQFAAFDRAAHDGGVTANLCIALSELAPASAHDGISVEFTWSRNRHRPDRVPSAVLIPSAAIDTIREAGEKLKAFEPWPDAKVVGLVTELKAPSDDDERDVAAVRCILDGRPRSVRVSVPAQYRAIVIAAFDSRSRISCDGVITRGATSSLVMREVRLISHAFES